MNKIEELKKIINESNNIVFFGGAGVSTESGIKDFRSEKGLYQQKYPKQTEYYLSSKCFYEEPITFFKFYKENFNCLNAKPNTTHKYLTKLETAGKLKAIITQNIDGLHQKANSQNVLEIHGSIYRNHCLNCHKSYPASFIFNSKGIPRCSCGGIIKPDVVLYGESLPEDYITASYYINKADTLIVAGSSLTVEPANSLIKIFTGKNLIIINRDKTPYDNYATLLINENLKNIIEKLI